MVIKAVALGNPAVPVALAGQTKGELLLSLYRIFFVHNLTHQSFQFYALQLDILRRQSTGWFWIKQKQ